MDVQPTTNQIPLGQPQGSTPQPTKPGELQGSNPRQTVTQDEFLKLLTIQLQNQDPLNPMDNQEFTAQLATFNSLDQLINISKKLDALNAEQLTLNQLQATTLIGKEVSTQGNRMHLDADGTAELPYLLAADAARVVINIMDSEGNVVRTLEAGAQKAGEQKVPWDGKDSNGKAVEQGEYVTEVNAFDAKGKAVQATTLIKGTVSGVDLAGSEAMLTIGGLQVPISAILSVRAPASS
jgi:flagellar basal-body rod modification protein FlgD